MESLVVLVKTSAVVACGVLAVSGNWVVRWLLGRIDAPGSPDGVAETRRRLGLVAAEAHLPGGRWIGILERAGVFACIVTGFPAGIAMVLAVKGLGRYADLKTTGPEGSRTGELFIIGTLTSMLWAAGWAGTAYTAVHLW